MAVRTLSGSEAVREAAGIGMVSFAVPWFDEATDALRERLGPGRFAEARANGHRASADDAVRAARAALTALRARTTSSATAGRAPD